MSRKNGYKALNDYFGSSQLPGSKSDELDDEDECEETFSEGDFDE